MADNTHTTPDSLNETNTVEGGMDVPVLLTISAVSTVLVIVAVLLIQAWFFRVVEREEASKNPGQANRALVELWQEQDNRLNEYRWVGQEGGNATITIDEAIDLVAKRGGKRE